MKTHAIFLSTLLFLSMVACKPEEPTDDPIDTGLPAAEFNVTQVDEVTYEFESLQGGSKHFWTFGDTMSTLGKRVEHSYTEAGDYEVTLTTTTSEGDRTGKKTISVTPSKTFLLSRGWVITSAQRNGSNYPFPVGANYRFFSDGTYTAGTLDGFTWEWNEDQTGIITNKATSYKNTWFVDQVNTQTMEIHFSTQDDEIKFIFSTTE